MTMTARSPSAFMLSVMIHAIFASAMFYTAYVLKDEVIDKGKIMELVAGEGDNYAATEAPALGTPEGVKFKLPDAPAIPIPPAPAPEPEPVAPVAPEPVQAVAPPPEPVPVLPKPTPKAAPKPKPETSPVTKAEAKKDPVVPDIVKNMKKVENRIAAKQKAQREKEAKAAEKAAAKAAADAAKLAELNARKAALMKSGQIKVAKIDAEGIAKGVVGGSTSNKTGGAGGTALSREEQDLLETYLALLSQRIRDAHEKPMGLSDLLAAQVEFYVAADGTLSRARILKSSGNAEFDQSVLAAVRNVRPIGPRPDGVGSMKTVRILMKDEE